MTHEISNLLVESDSPSQPPPQKRQETKNREERTLENYLKYSGFGLFHVFLLLVSGLATAADAVEIFGVSFVLPVAEEDIGLSTSNKGWLQASIFVGTFSNCIMYRYAMSEKIFPAE